MRRTRPLLLCLALIGATAGSAAASTATSPQRCDNKRAHTFATTVLSSKPKAYRAGARLGLDAEIKRVAAGAPDVQVTVTLRGKDWFAYGDATTDSAGKVSVRLTVPKKARGAGTLIVDVHRQLVSLPCGNIEEYDYLEQPWGSATK